MNEFVTRSIDSKIKLLYEKGTFIMSIRYYKHKINLFLFDNQYIEVFINHKLAQIEKVEFLDINNSRMKFYIDQIKLPEYKA